MSIPVYDFLRQTAILVSCRLEKVLSTEGGHHARLTHFNKQFASLPVNVFAEYLEDNPDYMTESRRRYERITERIPETLRGIASTVIDLTILCAVYPEVRDALRESEKGTTIETAFYMVTGGQVCPAELAGAVYECLRPIYPPEPGEDVWYARIRFNADRRLLDYLSSADKCSLPMEGGCELFKADSELPEIYLYGDVCNRLAERFSDGKCVIQICGDEGSGKRFMIKHMAQKCKKNVIFADFQMLSGLDNSERTVAEILREAIFSDAVVCWYHVRTNSNMSVNDFAVKCIKHFRSAGVQVCCCTDKDVNIISFVPLVVRYEIPPLTQQDRIILWEKFAEGRDGIEPVQFAVRYKLSCRQIAEVFRRREEYYSMGNQTEKQVFSEICSQVTALSGKLFNIVRPKYTLDDIVLKDGEKKKILEICANFRYYSKVYTEWDMQSKMPYGRAISVILCGPPGTGKTMTAHVIANELELPLFHADLSQITDKYIGETEKHLDEIFTEAEKSNCVLLLDEADAICGKRSEVTESKDRFANNATAFLLQRLEQYEGIVVLSTNFVNNLDTAFMRRMKYIMQFSIPTADVRKKIWESCFPVSMPVSDDIDTDYLAQQFDFAGANIKNIVLSAAFLAVSENKPVHMRHIIMSIENEYLKFQKHVLPGEFGKYSEMFLECSGMDSL